jgi:hypothetical protein
MSDDRPAGGFARDARHLGPFQRLSDLPGAAPAADPAGLDRGARRLPLQAALSRSRWPANPAACGACAAHRSDGPHLGFPRDRKTCCWRRTARPRASTRRFPGTHPLSAHGLMHMVISNAHAGDPYKIDTLFMYMANMAWNSSMNTTGDGYADRHRRERRLRDPEDHLFGRLFLGNGGLCRSDPARHHLSRTHDCISLLDRPICEAEAAADSIRWPVVEPDRDVRGFQSVLLDLGARLKLPGHGHR